MMVSPLSHFHGVEPAVAAVIMVGHGHDRRLGGDIQPAHEVQGVVVDAYVSCVFLIGKVADDSAWR
jgi:hypothetical protein